MATEEVPPSILTRSGILSSAQVQALNTVPVLLIETPGADRYIQVVSVHWWLNFNTTDYVPGATFLTVQWETTVGFPAEILAGAGFSDTAQDEHRIVYGSNLSTSILTPIGNQGIEAAIIVGGGAAWTTGDSPLHWEIQYRSRLLEF